MANSGAKIEAVLFIHGEPIALKKLAVIVQLSPEELQGALLALRGELSVDSRGLTLISEEPLEALFQNQDWGSKKIQLATKPDLAGTLSEFIKEEIGEELTPASLEVLSLIAYLGPVSRARVEYIRGVNSVFTLRTLLMRGLIERVNDPSRGNSFLYKPSFEFLRHMGVVSREELPEYEKFQALIQQEHV